MGYNFGVLSVLTHCGSSHFFEEFFGEVAWKELT